jgi:hypothetical protein
LTDIRADDFDLPALKGGQIEKEHGQGIRLFPGGTPRTPFWLRISGKISRTNVLS